MTIEEMKRRKTELGLTSEMISQLSGVPLGTVQKIFAGTTKAPRRLTIEALEKVLGRSDEASQAFPAAQGRRYTLDDYYALPDEQRVELIDGVFYDIAAPSYLHQAILIQLLRLFRIAPNSMICHARCLSLLAMYAWTRITIQWCSRIFW